MFDLNRILDELAVDPTYPVDLAEVALHLAVDEYPDLDVSGYLARLDDYAAAVGPRLTGSLSDKVAVFAEYLFDEIGLAGNSDDYYDAENSYLNRVLDRNLGLPITLTLVAMAVGERCGLTVHGLGLPGHFLAMATDGDEHLLFDPFHGGQQLDTDACSELIANVTGQPFHLTADWLKPTPAGFIVIRLLTNLKGTYLRTADFARAVTVLDRLVRLQPDEPLQQRDLGVACVHAHRPGKAITHLQSYLAAVPAAEDAAVVGEFLNEARKGTARWN